jgi:nucleoside-diphosphate-sugar epimerase
LANILVTGGAGFIGSHLAETLLKQGHQVRVLDNFSTGKKENLLFEEPHPSLEVINGDVRDLRDCEKAVAGVEYVFHQAALASVQRSVEDPLTTQAVNVGGTLHILMASREAGVKRVVYASSSAIYGDTPMLPKHEEMPPSPLSPYALQKYIGEQYCRLFSQLYGLDTLSLRYFNVFGPRQDPASIYSAVIPRFIEALVEDRSPIVYGDGEQSRDFSYVENVVEANVLAMAVSHGHGEVMNIACGQRTSLNQLLEILQRILGSKVRPVYQDPRPGDVKHSLADIGKAIAFLHYHPRVGIETGLEKTAGYFEKQLRR